MPLGGKNMPIKPSTSICWGKAQNTGDSVICGRKLVSPGLIVIHFADVVPIGVE
jgi:hypothetical protein